MRTADLFGQPGTGNDERPALACGKLQAEQPSDELACRLHAWDPWRQFAEVNETAVDEFAARLHEEQMLGLKTIGSCYLNNTFYFFPL